MILLCLLTHHQCFYFITVGVCVRVSMCVCVCVSVGVLQDVSLTVWLCVSNLCVCRSHVTLGVLRVCLYVYVCVFVCLWVCVNLCVFVCLCLCGKKVCACERVSVVSVTCHARV